MWRLVPCRQRRKKGVQWVQWRFQWNLTSNRISVDMPPGRFVCAELAWCRVKGGRRAALSGEANPLPCVGPKRVGADGELIYSADYG